MGIFRKPTEEEKQEELVARRAVWKSYDQLGPMTWVSVGRTCIVNFQMGGEKHFDDLSVGSFVVDLF